jgi:hypothetical protein
MSKKDTKFGLDLMQALKEVQAHRRAEIILPSHKVDANSKHHLKAIHSTLSNSQKDFEG